MGRRSPCSGEVSWSRSFSGLGRNQNRSLGGEPDGDATDAFKRSYQWQEAERASSSQDCEASCQAPAFLSGSCFVRERGRVGGRFSRLYGSEGNSSPAAVTGTLDKLTEILSLLSQDKLKKAKASKIDSEEGLRCARRALRIALQDTPEEISAVIEKCWKIS